MLTTKVLFWLEIALIAIGINVVLVLYPRHYLLWAVVFVIAVAIMAWVNRKQRS